MFWCFEIGMALPNVVVKLRILAKQESSRCACVESVDDLRRSLVFAARIGDLPITSFVRSFAVDVGRIVVRFDAGLLIRIDVYS